MEYQHEGFEVFEEIPKELTNFEKVCSLNEAFGRATTEFENPDWDAIEAQMEIIDSEYNELKTAVANRDWKEVKDGIGDVLVTTYGLGYVINIDCDLLMANIDESNFSKFCHDHDEAVATKKKYSVMGVETVIGYNEDYNLYFVLSAKDQIGKDGKDYPAKKMLKSINFKEPDLNVEI